MSRFGKLLLLFGLSFAFISNTAFMIFVLHVSEKARKNFEVTEARFDRAVFVSVSNYLDVVSGATNKYDLTIDREQSQEWSTPKVCFVVLGTWRDSSGRMCCSVDGVIYREGDYCEHGLVWRIDSGKVFCTDETGIVVLRPKPDRPAGDGRLRPPPPDDPGSGAQSAIPRIADKKSTCFV